MSSISQDVSNLNFVSETRIFSLKLRNCVSKTRDFALKMMIFADRTDGSAHQVRHL